MRLLAISYALPPMLYPQAIQIGRLLVHSDAEIGAVSGFGVGAVNALDCYADFDSKLAFHLSVPYRPRLKGLPFQLARRFLPLYGRIPDEYRSWVPIAEQAVFTQLSQAGFDPEVLVTFGEPMSDHLLGLRLKRRLGVPWIAHFSDPWFDNPFRAGAWLSNRINLRDERATVAAADQVIFTSKETLELVMSKYPAHWRSKTRVLPHSFDPTLYPARASKSGPIIVRHLGNFYGARTPYPLLRALRVLWERNRSLLDGVQFELVGRVPAAMRWHASYRRLPAGLVKVKGTVSYSQSLALMTAADLLLVMDAPSDLSVFLPSKLIDYLGSGTPVMGIVPPGTSASLLARLGGISADPRDLDEVVSGLTAAIAYARQWREVGGLRSWGNDIVRSEFDPARVAQMFLGMVCDVK